MYAISDFLTVRQYHRLALYNEVYRRMGAEEQIAFSVEIAPPLVIAVAFNRSRRIFTGQERTLLNLLHPHVVHAHSQARICTRVQKLEALDHTLGRFGHGVIILTLTGRVQMMTTQAQRWLEEYFTPLRGAHSPCLPELLWRWVNSGKSPSFSCSHPPLVVRRPEKTLTIQLVREEDKERLVLWLEEQTDDRQSMTFVPLGFTKRESDILYWLIRGKTNREIALRLGLSPNTVRTRLEDIFPKLGVSTRTAAALRAREAFFTDSGSPYTPSLVWPDGEA